MLAVGVHFPKSSGSSLGTALRRHYGDALALDYNDGPTAGLRQLAPAQFFSQRESPPPGARCVFGHFNPAKYRHLDAARFTILRHPIDTLISIYFFWRTVPITHALHRYVVEKNPTLTDFARLPQLQCLASKTFFGRVDMHSFDVIGRFADRERANARICALLGMPTFDDHENATPPSAEREAVENDPAIRAKLKDILRDGIAFYERWTERS